MDNFITILINNGIDLNVLNQSLEVYYTPHIFKLCTINSVYYESNSYPLIAMVEEFLDISDIIKLFQLSKFFYSRRNTVYITLCKQLYPNCKLALTSAYQNLALDWVKEMFRIDPLSKILKNLIYTSECLYKKYDKQFNRFYNNIGIRNKFHSKKMEQLYLLTTYWKELPVDTLELFKKIFYIFNKGSAFTDKYSQIYLRDLGSLHEAPLVIGDIPNINLQLYGYKPYRSTKFKPNHKIYKWGANKTPKVPVCLNCNSCHYVVHFHKFYEGGILPF